jgi:hypothetical protein
MQAYLLVGFATGDLHRLGSLGAENARCAAKERCAAPDHTTAPPPHCHSSGT